MIQANQLRVGNYVASDHFKDRDVIVKVRLIGQEQAIVEHPNGLTEPMLYQGEMRAIKLTEEILLKCGAKKDGWEFKLKASALEITIRLNAGYVYCEFGNVYLGDRITYLHELQNLYYGLSKRELEVKL